MSALAAVRADKRTLAAPTAPPPAAAAGRPGRVLQCPARRARRPALPLPQSRRRGPGLCPRPHPPRELPQQPRANMRIFY